MTAIPKLELVSAKKPNTCYACSGLGYYQEKTNGELQLCECVNDLCRSCDNNEIDKKNRDIYNAATDKKTHCKCKPFSLEFSRIKKLYDKSNIPSRYKLATLEMDMEHDRGINGGTSSLFLNTDLVREFLEEKEVSHRGFYLWGNTGSGKTHVACAILNNLILKKGIEARYCKVSKDFLEAIKATFTDKDKFWGEVESTSKAIENEFQKVPVLVLDDFGVQKETAWAMEKIYDLIDTRYENRRLTIVTSNKPMESLKGVFENRIYSRLCEMTRELFFEAIDYREMVGGAA